MVQPIQNLLPVCEALRGGETTAWKRITKDVDPEGNEGPWDECENRAKYFLDKSEEDPPYRLPICEECAERIGDQSGIATAKLSDLILLPITFTPSDGHDFVASAEFFPNTVQGTGITVLFQICFLCTESYRNHKAACELFYAHTGMLPGWAPWFVQNRE